MAGILASMLAGGAAGGFGAYGQVVDDRIKSSREDQKAAALEKRMLHMEELRQKYQTAEREAGQKFQSRFDDENLAKDKQAMAEKEALASYLRGDTSVGGDEYSVPLSKEDKMRGMGAEGILKIKEMETAEERRKSEEEWKQKEFDQNERKMKLLSKKDTEDRTKEKAFEYARRRASMDENFSYLNPDQQDEVILKYVNQYLSFGEDGGSDGDSKPVIAPDGKAYIKKNGEWYLVETDDDPPPPVEEKGAGILSSETERPADPKDTTRIPKETESLDTRIDSALGKVKNYFGNLFENVRTEYKQKNTIVDNIEPSEVKEHLGKLSQAGVKFQHKYDEKSKRLTITIL